MRPFCTTNSRFMRLLSVDNYLITCQNRQPLQNCQMPLSITCLHFTVVVRPRFPSRSVGFSKPAIRNRRYSAFLKHRHFREVTCRGFAKIPYQWRPLSLPKPPKKWASTKVQKGSYLVFFALTLAHRMWVEFFVCSD